MVRATDSDRGDEIGFGLTIVDLLGRQLRAKVDRSDADPGVKATLELPLN
jgi:two-component sensor histidine kinase